MEWLWTIVCVAVLGGAGYYYYHNADKSQASSSHEIHEAKGTLMSKTRDHEALWVHYSYKDAAGDEHEMSEKVPYVDLWENFKIGQEMDVLYNGDGLSVLKINAHPHAQTDQP